jgi:hypothetical protein
MYKALVILVLGVLLASCKDENSIKPLVEKKTNTITKDSTSLVVTNDDPPASSGNGRP